MIVFKMNIEGRRTETAPCKRMTPDLIKAANARFDAALKMRPPTTPDAEARSYYIDTKRDTLTVFTRAYNDNGKWKIST